MTARGYHYGHAMAYIDGEWRYEDTGESVATTHKSRTCGHCGLPPTPEGHDGCLGTLPGAMNACCGHGGTNEPYIQFPNGQRIVGDKAISEMCRLINKRENERAFSRSGVAFRELDEAFQNFSATLRNLINKAKE